MFEKVRDKLVPVVVGGATTAMMAVSAFAAEPLVDSGEPIVTTEMLSPILDSIKANIAVIIPVGIAIFGIMIGISLIPKLFSKFTSK